MEPPVVSKLSPDGAQHSEQCYVTVSVENIAVRTVYAKYLVLTLIGKVLHKFFLPQICTVLKAVLHVELAQCKTRSKGRRSFLTLYTGNWAKE